MIKLGFAVMAVLTVAFAYAFDATGKVRYWWGIMVSGLIDYILLFIEEFG